jgi:hypothetical protein
MVIQLDWLKKEVNTMLIAPDWLNMLVDRGENKVTVFKLSMILEPHIWTLGIVVLLTGM